MACGTTRWADGCGRVHRVGGLCVAAHPYAPYQSGTFMYPYQGFDLVEVWNGPWTSDVPWQADNEAALAWWGRGLTAGVGHKRRRPVIGNSDTHLEGQIGIPHTVVLAASQCRRDLRRPTRWSKLDRRRARSSSHSPSPLTSRAQRSVSGWRAAMSQSRRELRCAVCLRASSPSSLRKDPCTAHLCPTRARAPWRSTPAQRQRRSYASKYAIETATWRHSATRSS